MHNYPTIDIKIQYLSSYNKRKLRKEGGIRVNQCLRILFYELGFNSIIQLLKKRAHTFRLGLPNTWFIHYQPPSQIRESKAKHDKKERNKEKESIPMKLFPRSPSSTLDPSITVMDPTPPSTRFFSVSEPVGPQLSKQMLAFSRAVCPCSPHILNTISKIKI